MRALQILLVSLSALALTAAGALAANPGNPASLDAEASVEVITPIELAETGGGLNFGKVVRPASGDPAIDVTVSPDGTSVTAPAGAIVGSGPTATSFSVTADIDGTGVQVDTLNESCPAGLTLTASDDWMDGTLGSGTFGVGGTLNVTDAAAEGVNTCTYTVQAEYM